MSKTINPDDIPVCVLKGYINTIQELYKFKSISYRKIQLELKELYGVKIDIDRIEENCDELTLSTSLQYNN